MSHKSQKDTRYRPVQRINEVKELISIATTCADFPLSTLRHFNGELLKKIGFFEFSSKELQKYFCYFEPLKENLPEPLALAYHGHQFGSYNPDIGDGRGFLYAQFLDEEDRLLDLGTKGSGQTPFSRTGDGRLTLKGGVREILATEMLESQGVNTSKTLTLFETGEQLYRGDEPSPARSAVMVRLSHSHIRFGTFQRLAYLENKDGIAQLIDYCVRNYHPQTLRENFEDTVVEFFRAVVVATADMIASWMAAGFVHGVMNTDNMVITGESFDYGPYRFLPKSDPNFVAAYFDQGGRYRFGRQPDAGLWNLTQLAGCLLTHSTVPKLEAVLEEYSDAYKKSFRKHMFRRLGIVEISEEKDGHLLQELLTWMTQSEAAFEQTFFDWQGGGASEYRANESPQAALYGQKEFAPIRALFMQQTPVNEARLSHPYFQKQVPVTLLIDDVERVWSHIDKDDDWTPLAAQINWMRQALEAQS